MHDGWKIRHEGENSDTESSSGFHQALAANQITLDDFNGSSRGVRVRFLQPKPVNPQSGRYERVQASNLQVQATVPTDGYAYVIEGMRKLKREMHRLNRYEPIPGSSSRPPPS